MTLTELAEDWIQARTALKRQLKLLNDDPVFPKAGLSDDARKAIAAHMKAAMAEYDALLKQFPDA